MKFVVVSDLHHDWKTCGVPRAAEIQAAVTESVYAAVNHHADAWIFTGDLCDPDEPVAVIAALGMMVQASTILRHHHIRVICVAGNHDVQETGTGQTVLHPMAGMPHGIYVFQQPGVWSMQLDKHEDTWVDVLGLPYTATSHAYDPVFQVKAAAEQRAKRSERPILVLGHLHIPGVQPGEETTEMPRGREVVFPVEEVGKLTGPKIVINGHYHRRQAFRPAGQEYVIHIPGSVARLTFAEEKHTPGYLLVEA